MEDECLGEEQKCRQYFTCSGYQQDARRARATVRENHIYCSKDLLGDGGTSLILSGKYVRTFLYYYYYYYYKKLLMRASNEE